MPAHGIHQLHLQRPPTPLLGLVRQVVPGGSQRCFFTFCPYFTNNMKKLRWHTKHFYTLHSFIPRRINFSLLKKATFPNFLSVGLSSAKQGKWFTQEMSQTAVNKQIHSVPKLKRHEYQLSTSHLSLGHWSRPVESRSRFQ